MPVARGGYSTQNQSAQGTSVTFSSPNISGSNKLLLVFFTAYNNQTDNITGVTHNGNAMTRLALPAAIGGGVILHYCYGIVAPADGTNNIVISSSANKYFDAIAVYYTGAAQSLPSVIATQRNTNSATISTSLTTTVDNSFIVASVRVDGTDVTANSGETEIVANNVNTTYFEYSSNPKTPAGSATMTSNRGNDAFSGYKIMVAIEPVGSSSAIKSINGLAKASIKSINGLTISSVKSWNGLA